MLDQQCGAEAKSGAMEKCPMSLGATALEAPTPEERSNRTRPMPVRKLPDVAICRAKRSGFGGYVDCLVDRPHECLFSLPFRSGRLCIHPTREDILARTKP